MKNLILILALSCLAFCANAQGNTKTDTLKGFIHPDDFKMDSLKSSRPDTLSTKPNKSNSGKTKQKEVPKEATKKES